MYFDTTTTSNGLPLLLPEESCLAEDENAVFHVHCEREGFHLFGWGDVDFNNIPAKIYLTTYRLIFVPFPAAKQKYNSFSICIEAIREPHLQTYEIYGHNAVDFIVCLEHGQTAAHRDPDSCRTVDELFDPGLQDVPPQHHTYRKCKIRMTFQKTGKAKMFHKGINLLAAEGRACPTRKCRFIEYEDLPRYNPTTPSPPPFDDWSNQKLPIY